MSNKRKRDESDSESEDVDVIMNDNSFESTKSNQKMRSNSQGGESISTTTDDDEDGFLDQHQYKACLQVLDQISANKDAELFLVPFTRDVSVILYILWINDDLCPATKWWTMFRWMIEYNMLLRFNIVWVWYWEIQWSRYHENGFENHKGKIEYYNITIWLIV